MCRSLPVTALLALFVASALGCGETRPRRSVLLITIDTLRADHVSRAGQANTGRGTTPALDAFSRRGTWFERAFSTCSYTVPSHASMMTGVYPSFHTAGLLNGQIRLLDTELTLAETCREAGLRTAAIVSNIVLRRAIGLNQGFEDYDDELPHVEIVRRVGERRAPNAVTKTLQKIDELGDESFFLWVHMQDPHGPYTPPKNAPEPAPVACGERDAPDETELPAGADHSGYRAIPRYQVFHQERQVGQYRRRYEREIAFLDAQLQRLFDGLDERGTLEHTLVVITADHGEALGEDGFWFGHSHSVGLDQVRVPLLFVGPGVRADASVAQPVSNLGVYATVLAFLGLEGSPMSQSHSLLPVLTEGAPPPSAPFFTESLPQRGIVLGELYMRVDNRPAEDTEFWRINPQTDGTMLALGTEVVRLLPASEGGGVEPAEPTPELEGLLEQFARSAERSLSLNAGRRQRPKRTEADTEALRALGYAGDSDD